jgi:hypothetical protein
MEKEFVWDTQLSGFAKRTRNGKRSFNTGPAPSSAE